MTTYKLVPLTKEKDENPIIQLFNDAALSQDVISRLVEAIPDIKLFVKNARAETKLGLLSGEYVGRENIIYEREKTLDWFVSYLENLPIQINEAKKRKILEEERAKVK